MNFANTSSASTLGVSGSGRDIAGVAEPSAAGPRSFTVPKRRGDPVTPSPASDWVGEGRGVTEASGAGLGLSAATFRLPARSRRTRYQTVRAPSAVGGLPSPLRIPLLPSADARPGQEGALVVNSSSNRAWFCLSQRYSGDRWPRPLVGCDLIAATIWATSGEPAAGDFFRVIARSIAAPFPCRSSRAISVTSSST